MADKNTSDCLTPEEMSSPGGCEADGYALERNRFFSGKFMTACDFRLDQHYFLRRRWLQNRLFVGWGIACGLRVEEHPREECRRDWVVVQPGIALDCCGREIILDGPRAVKLPEAEPGKGEAGTDPMAAGQEQGENQQPFQGDGEDSPEPGKKPPRRFLLCIRYCEQSVDPVPVLYADSGCDPDLKEANRIQEHPVIEVIPFPGDQFGPGCWEGIPAGDPGKNRCKEKEKDKEPEKIPPRCSPDCPCGPWVPLALIEILVEGESKIKIDMSGKKDLHLPGEHWTHIVETSWKHGGDVDPDMNELTELWVRFSRPLKDLRSRGVGINEHTFRVEYRHAGSNPEVLVPREEPYLHPDDGHKAVFPLPRDFYSRCYGTVVTIQLKCDFILDCHDVPVDGNYLRAGFPTGNRHAGGMFESWFFYGPYKPFHKDGAE